MTSRSTINTSMTPYEWGLLVTLSVLWGGSFFFNGVAVKELPTFTIVVARVALAAAVLLLVMRATGQRMPMAPGVWLAFFGMGLLNNVIPFSLIAWGQIHVASGVASILNATTPLFTVVVAHFLTTDEKMTGARLLGVAAGFAGVVAMIGGDALEGVSSGLLAVLAILVAAISYSFASLFGRRFRAMGVPPMATATGQVVASSAVLVPVMLAVEQPWTLPMPGIGTIGALAGVAVLSTALAYIIYFRILSTAGATNLMLVTFLIPVSAVLLGIAFLGEVLLPKHVLGMALIGIGMAAVDGRPWKWMKAIGTGRRSGR